MTQSFAGTLPFMKLDAFALTGHQNPARSFFGPEWCVSTVENLEARGIFDSGGYLRGCIGVFGHYEEENMIIWFFENGRSEPLLFSPEKLRCHVPLQKGDQVFVHVGNKNGRLLAFAEFVAYRPPGLCEVPFGR